MRVVKPKDRSKRGRKNRYIPNLAAAQFKPTEDWSVEKARREYQKAVFNKGVDRIVFRDCVKEMGKLPEESVDVIIADPPFGLSFTGKESMYNRDDRFVRDGYQEIEGDYEEFSRSWILQLPRIMKDTGSAWIFSGWTHLREILNTINESGLMLVNHIIWKYPFGVFTRRKFVTSHYHVLFLVKSSKYYFNRIAHYPLDIWEINRTYRRGEMKNGTKLPEELIARCIEFTSRPGSLILDPFMGNGTTAVAAKGTFRHYLGFEVNKSMDAVIETNLGLIKLGEFYVPYGDRSDELVTRARQRYGLDPEKSRIEV